MSVEFKDRVVIVTGAGNGLGRQYALDFAAKGAKVVVNDLGGSTDGGGSSKIADTVVDLIKQAGGQAVANYDSVVDGAKIVQTALDAFGRVDVVVNNAGILRDVSFAKMNEKDWDLINLIHLKGTYAVTRAAWPHMRKQGFGRIIFVTSAAGLYGNFGQAHYSAVKMAVVGLMNTLAKEGQSKNVLCNTIAPLAASRMTKSVLPPPLFEALKPEFVSPLVLYLGSEANSSTGHVYEVGAGWVSQVRFQRSQGVLFDAGKMTPDAVGAKIEQIGDFDKDPQYPGAPSDAFGIIMGHLEKQKSKL